MAEYIYPSPEWLAESAKRYGTDFEEKFHIGLGGVPTFIF